MLLIFRQRTSQANSLLSESCRVKVFGVESGFSIWIIAPVSDRFLTMQSKTERPSLKMILAPRSVRFRADTRLSGEDSVIALVPDACFTNMVCSNIKKVNMVLPHERFSHARGLSEGLGNVAVRFAAAG